MKRTGAASERSRAMSNLSVPRRRMAEPAATVALLSILLLAACGGPRLRSGSEADPSAARGLLVATSATGEPLPLVIDEAPSRAFPTGPGGIAGTATAAVTWLGARFAPTDLRAADPDRRRVVLRFEDVPRNAALACAAEPVRGGVPPEPVKLYAVFCDGARPVADIDGTAAGDGPSAADELVTLSMNRLFPGDGNRYSAFPGVSLGVGVGSGGGWGLGGGLFF